MANSIFSENGETGFSADVYCLGGGLSVEVTNLIANGNTGYGIQLMEFAIGAGSDFTIILRDSNLSGNAAGPRNFGFYGEGGGVSIIENVIE